MKILLAIPSKFEAAPAFKIAGAKPALGAAADVSQNLRAFVAGIGCKASAERLAKEIGEFKPDALALLGYCGACAPDLKIGDFVFDADDETLAQKISGAKFRREKFACVEKTAGDALKAALYKDGFGAVEMESAFFAPLAKARALPFLHIRCVSDARGGGLPAEVLDASMDRQTGAVNPSKIFFNKRVLKEPRIALKLVKFIIGAARAQKKYGRGAAEIIKELQ